MKHLQVFLLCLLALVVYARKDDESWQNFKLKYNKDYKNEIDENRRRNIFFRNKKRIENHNSRFDKKEVTYKMAINKFSDMANSEFHQVARGMPPLTPQIWQEIKEQAENVTIGLMRGPLPANVDWREKGAVGPVQNQYAEQCGSCYAFSAAAALESHIFIKSRNLHKFSEQQLVDCSEKFGNFGCHGGYPAIAFQYVKKTGGIAFEKDYPYKANNDKCLASKNKLDKIRIKGYVNLQPGNEEDLKRAVATFGPVTAGMHSNTETFKEYKEGVLFTEECHPSLVDHAILIVGYGTTEDGVDYWIFKNSYGKSWGMDGYGYLARNKDNHCGIATITAYPIIKDAKIIRAKITKPK